MNDNFLFYAFCLIAIVTLAIVIRKVASCLIKTVVLIALVAGLALLYFAYFAQ